MRPGLLCAVLAAVCATVPAEAAEPWSPQMPVVAAPTQGALYFPGVVADGRGAHLVFTRRFNDFAEFAELEWQAANGLLINYREPPGTLVASPVEVSPGRFGVLIARRPGGALAFAVVSAAAPGEPFQTVAKPRRPLRSAALASDAHGTVAIAWLDLGKRARLRLSVRRPGRRFSRPVTVARGRPGNLGPVALAVAPGGRPLVAYVRSTVSTGRVVTWTPGRRARTVGKSDPGDGVDLRAAAGPDGTVAVAWGSRFFDECPVGNKEVSVAVRPRGARRFRPARRLGSSPVRRSCDSRTVGVAVDGQGRSTVAWSQWDSVAARTVHATLLDRGAGLIATATLGRGDFGGLAVRADGAAIVAWTDAARDPRYDIEGPMEGQYFPGTGPGQATAAVRAASDEHFGAAERVSDARMDAGPPGAAFDPATGAPWLAWSAIAVAGDPPAGQRGTGGLYAATRPSP